MPRWQKLSLYTTDAILNIDNNPVENAIRPVAIGLRPSSVTQLRVMGETSKLLSERFGKIMQDRQSVSVNRTDTSISHSKQLDSAIPASKIAALSSGEFVGLVADNPEEKIKLKMFHAEIINDADKLNEEVSRYKEIPVVSNVTQQQVMDNYYQVKMEVKLLIDEEVERLKEKLDK